MAIPTQFSVANTNIAPIANPPLAKDLPKVIEAEEHSLVDGANIIPSLSSVGVSAPQEMTAETAVVIANPSTKTAQGKLSINAPVEKTAQGKAISPAPSVLTPKAGTLTTPPFPLNHARILYDNKLIGASASSDISTGEGSPSYATIPNTYQSFYGSGSGYLRIDINFDSFPDTVCIGAHNLGSKGYNVTPYYRETATGPLIQFAAGVTPTDNSPIMFHRSDRPKVRVVSLFFVPTSTSNTFKVGYVSAGVSLQMQRPFFNGHQPYTDSDITEYYSNRTESGEIIGRQIRRRGFETTYEWQNIDDNWYRNNIPAFKDYAKKWPMFVAWNLLEYPSDVAFGETKGDIKASMQNGARTKRTGLSFTLKGV